MELYSKPPLLYADQASLLISRGLTLDSIDDAISFLQHVNYYRFSAYCIPFQTSRDVFSPGTNFRQIVELYRLDEDLRNSMLALLSPVEVHLRTRVVYELSYGWGAFSHYDTSLFRRNFDHPEWAGKLEGEIGRAKEAFIEHYKSKYSGFPRLPFWMACEVMSLGSLSLLYSGLLPDPQRRICSIYGIHHEVLRNWFHVITYIRNICAHHGRLWNRELSIRPEIPHKNREWTSLNLDNRFLFAVASVLEWICKKSALPLSTLKTVHYKMQGIAEIDSRFVRMMGTPKERTIGMCWGAEE
jgi:abortive infection bacteriophage resistance protein